jgi:AbrB family looped-hinge helix DNA binding protein
MTYFTTMTSKGQITLPVAIRRKLDFKPGQRIEVNLNNKKQATIEAPTSLLDVGLRARADIKSQGWTDKKLAAFLESYKNGDGFEASLKEKNGQS